MNSIEDDGDQFLQFDSGVFTWDLEKNLVYADAAIANLFGLEISEALTGLPMEAYIACIHSGDRSKAAKSLHDAIVTGEPYHGGYRLPRGGDTVEVVAFGRCFRTTDGTPYQFAGVISAVDEASKEDGGLTSHIVAAHRLAVASQNTKLAEALGFILDDLSSKGDKEDTYH